MNAAIIDADLINLKHHRFPNLACMKLSGYHKALGHEVYLKLNYDGLDQFDQVYISRVFSKTLVPRQILKLKNVSYGGTGFFSDKAPKLPPEIEHQFPDYHLYDEFIATQDNSKNNLFYYQNASIGFTTRGCFRKCSFCINKNSHRVTKHSPVSEFLHPDRKAICLLDDNFLGYIGWKKILWDLIDSKKLIEFKQGLDIRLMTEESAEMLSQLKLKDKFYFSFDNIKDKEIIEKKIIIFKKYNREKPAFYLLCAYFDMDLTDIVNLFERIDFCRRFNASPYILRYEDYVHSEFRSLYIAIAAHCNQFRFFKTHTFREFCIGKGKGYSRCSITEAMMNFEKKYPDIAKKYYDLK